MIGKTITHYHIIEKLGEGGMGVVYKARDKKLERLVALKFLSKEFTLDSDAKTRLIREAKTTARLNHINICTIYEIDEVEDQFFIAMEYVKGKSLKEKFGNQKLSANETIQIITQIIAGLSHAHKQGIVHRDIKPSNILITDEGVVKILDFGIAKLKGQTQFTQAGKLLGTINYISPEQAGGDKVDQRTDIWSTGVLFYQLLTGKLPFQGDYDQVLIYSILHEPPISLSSVLPEIPEEIEQIIEKALQKDLQDRYQTINEMEYDIGKVTGENLNTGSKRNIGIKNRLKKYAIPPAILALLLIIFFLLRPLIINKPDLENPIRIAVISFENQTGSDTYDYLQDAIPNLLITSLEQSPYLHVTTWERMHDLLRQTGQQDIRIIDKDLGYQLCRMDGVNLIVLGSYVKAGDIFATDIKVYDVTSNKLIASVSSKGEGISSILQHQIDDLSKEISKSIGFSEEIIASSQVDMAKVTTSSMEAYRNFLEGAKKFNKQYYNEAAVYFENAIELDSTFASAHLLLVLTYSNLREIENVQESLDKAILYSGKVSEKERLKIEEMAAAYGKNDQAKRIQILEQMVERFPYEKDARYSLAFYYYWDQYNYDKAQDQYNILLSMDPDYSIALRDMANLHAELRQFDEAFEYVNRFLKCDPENASAYETLAKIYFYKGEFHQAIENFKHAIEIKPDFKSDVWIAYTYALLGNFADALDQMDRFISISSSPGLKAQGYWYKAFFLQCWSGQYQDSDNNFQKAYDLWESIGNEYGLAVIKMSQAYGFLTRGKYEQSKLNIRVWAEYQSSNQGDPVGEYLIKGLVNIKCGEVDSARYYLEKSRKLAATRTKMNQAEARIIDHAYNGLNAELLLAEGDFDKAVLEGQKNKQIVIPRFDLRQFMAYNIPVFKDYLPRAYLQKGNLNKAIEEYEYLISVDQGRERFRLIHPIYHYRLAQLYEDAKQYQKAIKQYQVFLKLWENADEDLPEITETKIRLQELNKYMPAS
jgi:serine/threonine protein kinase/Tfp pilus assembly protein PilF